jgi:hypothetical protein
MRSHLVATAVILLALMTVALWPTPRFTVHLPDGTVVRNLTRRQADEHCANIAAAAQVAAAASACGVTRVGMAARAAEAAA